MRDLAWLTTVEAVGRRIRPSSLGFARDALAGQLRAGRRSAVGLETAERRLTARIYLSWTALFALSLTAAVSPKRLPHASAPAAV
ncbi:MAG: hypothetical protein INR62_09400 [Rhodospirillales bacterium]|nr:hypothetical protein [Acetobacter sp.]